MSTINEFFAKHVRVPGSIAAHRSMVDEAALENYSRPTAIWIECDPAATDGKERRILTALLVAGRSRVNIAPQRSSQIIVDGIVANAGIGRVIAVRSRGHHHLQSRRARRVRAINIVVSVIVATGPGGQHWKNRCAPATRAIHERQSCGCLLSLCCVLGCAR